ncbi:DUF4307 domain-containing protein [Isoptericola jiangsuensis]|uniref:DUF4307 domain-containing protein n=1 Tax=Isoptericola jiangsuensis TaxID=548579 RepID=UPI003AAB936F
MSSSQSPTTPVGRYGAAPRADRGPLGRGGKVAIGVALAVAVGLVAWYTFLQQLAQPVTHDMIGFDVRGAESIDVTFQVHMPPGTTAVCTVEALSPSYAQVGTVDVEVGPSETRTTVYEVPVGTSQTATTGVVAGCTATDR